MDNLSELVKHDIEKPVCKWTEQDKQDWRDMGWRIPRCNCEECKQKASR